MRVLNEEVISLIKKRGLLKESNDYVGADTIRNDLYNNGVVIRDVAGGVEWNHKDIIDKINKENKRERISRGWLKTLYGRAHTAFTWTKEDFDRDSPIQTIPFHFVLMEFNER